MAGHSFDSGMGHAMKANNNLVGRGTYDVVAEALAVGERYGLDPHTMIDVMNASTGRSFDALGVACEHSEAHGHRWEGRPAAGAEG